MELSFGGRKRVKAAGCFHRGRPSLVFEFSVRLSLGRRFLPLGLYRGILNSPCHLILLIHTKNKQNKMKSQTPLKYWVAKTKNLWLKVGQLPINIVCNGWNQICVDNGKTVSRFLCWPWCLNFTDKQGLETINNFEFCLTWFTYLSLFFEIWSISLGGTFKKPLHVEYLMLTCLKVFYGRLTDPICCCLPKFT